MIAHAHQPVLTPRRRKYVAFAEVDGVAIGLVIIAAVILVILARRACPWWVSMAVILLVAAPWISGYANEVGEDDTQPGLLLFGGVISVGVLVLLEVALRINRRRSARKMPSRHL